MHDIPEIVDHTFPKAMIPINIQAEFRVLGLVPLNRDVFEYCYFMPVETKIVFLISEQYHSKIIIVYLLGRNI